MSNAPARFALLVALACGAGARLAPAQSPAAKEAPAAVEGRVTDGERGLPGVVVALLTHTDAGRLLTAARTKTDHDGRYRLAGAPPGGYQVTPLAPAYVLPGPRQGGPPGHFLTLAAGETVEDVDFRLERGGVITGRVTDADGRPVVNERVEVLPAGGEPSAYGPNIFYRQLYVTDDRGVYRVYGLPAGGYRVGVGQDAPARLARPGGSRRFYRRTFHPDATEESKAKVVKVEAGGEASDIDITLGPVVKTYRAAGRFVAADGRPAAGATFGYGPLDAEGTSLGMFDVGLTTNARGEFVIESLAPGRYAVFAATLNDSPTDFYSDAVTFEVDGADVSGLEVRLRRAASLSGVVQIEGTSDRATIARLLRQVKLFGHVETAAALSAPSYAQSAAGADGSFRLGGLRPGRLRLSLIQPQMQGLMLARVELNGAEQRDGIEVSEGAQVTGARVLLVYGNAAVRGQVTLTNGALPPGARLVVFARRLGGTDPYGGFGKGAEADARGRFVMEGVAAGGYEFTARVFTQQGQRHQSPRVMVNVPESGEVIVTLTVDLAVVNDK